MSKGMVNYPDGGDWEDSGEGGLYSMLVVVKPVEEDGQAWAEFCHVDVVISLPAPDVCVSMERTDLWEPRSDYRDSGFARMMDAGNILKKENQPRLMQWVYGTRSHLDESVELLSANHIGSTSQSLWSPSRGSYFEAGYGDLTEQGRAMFDAMKAAYGIEPLLLTFLDT